MNTNFATKSIVCIPLLLAGISCGMENAPKTPSSLFPRNTEAPFPYKLLNERAWRITDRTLAKGDRLTFTTEQNKSAATRLVIDGVRIEVTPQGHLIVRHKGPQRPVIDLRVTLQLADGSSKSQQLRIRPASKSRPICYVADLSSEVIRIFWNHSARRFRPITQDGFDQYFRRLQAHGCSRLIVWQSPFPFMADPKTLSKKDWERYQGQAIAIRDSSELQRAFEKAKGLPPWMWLREIMALRLQPELNRLFADSAAAHGIQLTASFRPFEHSLGKYYEIPTFDHTGEYLWGFSPLVSPSVNYHRDLVGFAHQREILARLGAGSGAPEFGNVHSIEWHSFPNAKQIAKRFAAGKRDFEIYAGSHPPLDSSSFVLQRGSDGKFSLKRVSDVAELVDRRLEQIDSYKLTALSDRVLKIVGLKVPTQHHILRIRARTDFARGLDVPGDLRLVVRAKAGHRLGRMNAYWSLGEDEEKGQMTRVGAITSDGSYRAEFQATQNSISRLAARQSETMPWKNSVATLNLGRRWSMEMVDFEQPAARAFAVNQLKSLLAHPAYDEIILNTRSHTQLAQSEGEAIDRVDTIGQLLRNKFRGTGYRSIGRTYIALSLDRGFAPRSVAETSTFKELALDKNSVERISVSQPGEWQATCQDSDTPFQWRFQRNRAIASGIRALLLDLEKAFPDTRIRAVIPQAAQVDQAMEKALSQMRKPDGKVYGMQFFRHIWSTNNYINVIGEGMTMVDLSGTRVEPVFLGIRFAPDQGPLQLFVDLSIKDLSGNRGSRYRGPKAFFYEAQETLRAPYRKRFTERRQDIIRFLLNKEAINEVLLYEAVDWAYSLPVDDPHQYLDKQSNE